MYSSFFLFTFLFGWEAVLKFKIPHHFYDYVFVFMTYNSILTKSTKLAHKHTHTNCFFTRICLIAGAQGKKCLRQADRYQISPK